MDLSIWFTILIVAIVIAAYQFWSEEVKAGERFSAILASDGTIAKLDIHDVVGTLMYSTGDDSVKGTKAEIFIQGGANAFCMCRDSTGKVIGLGPFVDSNNDVVNKFVGKRSEYFSIYTDPSLLSGNKASM